MQRFSTVLTVLFGFSLTLPVFASAKETESPRNSDKLWSLHAVRRQPPPIVERSDWARNAIDRFVLRRLEVEEVAPSAEADRLTLTRRVTLDLIGLPPTPGEVDAFLNDVQPGAYERLVDRLLASPQYGEKWARPWMDLCHYGDTDGYLTDQLRPYAWRYRVWLIDALNANMPFDQFTVEQLAGDLLPDASVEQKIATGFLRQTLSNREGGAEPEEFRVLQVVDRTSMVGTIWLGLTVGCARCHDHMYDPISQREFYQLYAFFDNADEVNIDAPLPGQWEPYAEKLPEYTRQRAAVLAPVKDELWKLERRWELRLLQAAKHPGQDAHWDRQWELLGLVWGGGQGEGQLEGVEIVKLDPAKRTQRQQDDILDCFLNRPGNIDSQRCAELKVGELRSKIAKLKAQLPKLSRGPTMRAAQNPRQTYIHIRGSFRDHGPNVRPNVPACLPNLPTRKTASRGTRSSHGSNPTQISAETMSSRLSLARWLVAPNNPLTPRVTVNRIWQEFFGRGLVLTSEDFGRRGSLPSHPELLDWLASEFIRRQWNVKAMHRLIVTSATYRQSSRPRPGLTDDDPNNVLLARQSSLRVSAETIRDSALSVSGLLSRRVGGPSVKPPQPQRVTMEAFDNKPWKASEGDDRYRRGVYTFVIRTAPFAQAAIFDAPNPGETCVRRERSNTPLQALTLLNDEVFFEAAQALAARLLRECPDDAVARMNRAFRLCLARRPTRSERKRLVDYLQQTRQALRQRLDTVSTTNSNSAVKHLAGVDPVEAAVWTGVASVLLNLHEFITRD